MLKVEEGQRVRVSRFILERAGFWLKAYYDAQIVETWEGIVETVYSDWTFDLRLLDGTLANFDPRATNAKFEILE
jgi:hypothetical protein